MSIAKKGRPALHPSQRRVSMTVRLPQALLDILDELCGGSRPGYTRSRSRVVEYILANYFGSGTFPLAESQSGTTVSVERKTP